MLLASHTWWHWVSAAVLLVSYAALVVKIERARLRAEEERRLLTTVLDNLPAGVFLTDSDMRLRFAAGRALKEAGYDPETLIGQSVPLLVGYNTDEMLALYASALSGETGRLLHWHQGSEYYTQAVPVDLFRGSFCVLVTSVDLTLTRQLEGEMREAIEQLRTGARKDAA